MMIEGIKALGDSAWLVEFPEGTAPSRVAAFAAALESERVDGVVEVVASYGSLAVHYEGEVGMAVRRWIEGVRVAEDFQWESGGRVEVPVCYDGADLDELAGRLGWTREAVVACHAGAEYVVAAVGFAPGFPYLSGLPEALHLPRRATPRVAVPAGSVAIGGGQAGIYPQVSPGGWHLLGRTGMRLFDPYAFRPARLRAGDRVKFVPVEAVEEVPATTGGTWGTKTPAGSFFEVVEGGGLTTVQDLGRRGFEASGVSPGGAADPEGLRVANLLVGNAEGAAALECCVRGPILRFPEDAVVAFWDGGGRPRRVTAGEVVDFTTMRHGVRGYLAVAGGIEVPRVLGSAATDVRGGFGGWGGRALRAGDRVGYGVAGPGPEAGDWQVGRGWREGEIELRFLAGVQEDGFPEKARRRFREEIYQVTPRSDRMGTRLEGAGLETERAGGMVSQPVACGSVQVPPDGQPIVLMAERQTLGGYPQIGHVICADLPKLARAWPGTRVRFREVDWDEAQAAKVRTRRDFQGLRVGLDFLKSGA